MEEHKRNPVLHLNKFQQRLLFPIVITTITTSAILVFALLYLYYIGEHIALFTTLDKPDFEIAIPWYLDIKRYNLILPVVLLAIASLLAILVGWAFYLTHQMIGPYERVIRELDQVIDRAKKDPILVRKDDELFEELLKRINALIKKLP